jgi:urocanate hydratase
MAEMATHVALGNTARGMSLVTLHNGGGVGISKAINGGYGLVLDGSRRVDDILKTAMLHDVMTGVARRSWARNEHAVETCKHYNDMDNNSVVTMPHIADDELVNEIVGVYKNE